MPTDPLWTAKQDSISLPGQVGLPGLRHSIGLARWWHLSMDLLWLLNGMVFYVLLFATGQWQRLVPTSWAVFPNALSVLIQYLSLNWPVENTWVAYNGLQLIAYFVTVFVAAPLALITGLGMSPALSTRFKRLSKALQHPVRPLRPLPGAGLLPGLHRDPRVARVRHRAAGQPQPRLRRAHRRQLGRVLAVRGVDGDRDRRPGWRPRRSRCATLGSCSGSARRSSARSSISSSTSTPNPVSTARPTSPRTSGTTASTPTPMSTRPCSTGTSPTSGCGSTAWSSTPVDLDLAQLRALPHHEQITQHFCIQGWSGVAKWGGVSMQTILDLVKPHPEAKWVVFYSLGEGADKGVYYDAHPIEHMGHHLTMLAYDMNDQPLSFGHGAPLRLRNEIELGFKQVKWIKGIEFVAHYVRARRRLRRLQPGPRVLRLPPVDLTGFVTHQEGPHGTQPHTRSSRNRQGPGLLAAASTLPPPATDDDPLHRRVPPRSRRGLGRRAVLLPQPARPSPTAAPTAAVGARPARARRPSRIPHRLSAL